MKYCSNCGQPLREGVKVCTNCGTPVQRFNQHHRHSQYSDQRRPYQQSVNKQSQSPKDNKKFWIIITIVLVVLITLFVVFVILKSQLSPSKQASQISHAIKKMMHNHYLNN